MKSCLHFCASAALVLQLLAAFALAQATAPVDDLSRFSTADALWAHLDEVRKPPSEDPKSREEMAIVDRRWFSDQKEAAAAFVAKYPSDPRRYGAKIVYLQSALKLSRLPDVSGPKITADEVLRELGKIEAASDAPEDARGEAKFVQAMMQAASVDPHEPATIRGFMDASNAFLKQFPRHRLVSQMRQTQFQLAANTETPETETLLKGFVQNNEATFAEPAKQILARREQTRRLKTRPVDLKFTASDGHEVDLAALRGKVVLIDFWASWCEPCMLEAPNLVASYQRLHTKGFEIVGVSLDEEKDAMEQAIARTGMSWAQSFEGKSYQGSIPRMFGVSFLPVAWLLDKKGMVRETTLVGESLTSIIEKLLQE